MMRVNLRSFTLFLMISMISSLMLLGSPSFLFAHDSLTTRADSASDSESALVLIDETESSGCQVSMNGGKEFKCEPLTVYTTEVWPLSKAKATEAVVYVELNDQNKTEEAHKRLREKADEVTEQTTNSNFIEEQTPNSRRSCPWYRVTFGATDNGGQQVGTALTYRKSFKDGRCRNVHLVKNEPQDPDGDIYLWGSTFSDSGAPYTYYTWRNDCTLLPHISHYDDGVVHPDDVATFGYHLSKGSWWGGCGNYRTTTVRLRW